VVTTVWLGMEVGDGCQCRLSKALTIYENVDKSNNSIIFILRMGLSKLKTTRQREVKNYEDCSIMQRGFMLSGG